MANAEFLAFGVSITLLRTEEHAQGVDRRVLPVYYSDNLFHLWPRSTKHISLEHIMEIGSPSAPEDLIVLVEGWNVHSMYVKSVKRC